MGLLFRVSQHNYWKVIPDIEIVTMLRYTFTLLDQIMQLSCHSEQNSKYFNSSFLSLSDCSQQFADLFFPHCFPARINKTEPIHLCARQSSPLSLVEV